MIGNDFLGRAEEVEELAKSLLQIAERLRSSPSTASEARLFWPEDRQVRANSVAGMIALRKQRSLHLDASLFGEPAWDMLLALYKAYLSGTALTSEQVCQESGSFASTARRWLDILVDRGFVETTSEVRETRQIGARLTDQGVIGMTRIFIEMHEMPAA